MPINIKKRVPLDFLGTDYKDAYLTFSVVTVSEYETLIPKMEAVRDDRVQSANHMLAYVKSKFVEGKFPDDAGKLQPVVESDLDGLDEGTLVDCFERMTGRTLDPKA